MNPSAENVAFKLSESSGIYIRSLLPAPSRFGSAQKRTGISYRNRRNCGRQHQNLTEQKRPISGAPMVQRMSRVFVFFCVAVVVIASSSNIVVTWGVEGSNNNRFKEVIASNSDGSPTMEVYETMAFGGESIREGIVSVQDQQQQKEQGEEPVVEVTSRVIHVASRHRQNDNNGNIHRRRNRRFLGDDNDNNEESNNGVRGETKKFYATAGENTNEENTTAMDGEVRPQEVDQAFSHRSGTRAQCTIEVQKVERVPGKCVRLKGAVSGCQSLHGNFMEPFSEHCS